LSAALQVEADITDATSEWESPIDSQEIVGVQVFRGFVYSTTGATVSVKLMVESPISVTREVPWGSARTDVGPNPPQLNSGFGFTANVGDLPPGSATISMEFREGTGSGPCSAPTCLKVTRTFTVVKPGGQGGEATSFFNFLSDLDTTGANLALDPQTAALNGGPEIIVAPVTVTDSDMGTVRQATLRLRWLQNTQNFSIVAAASGTSYSAVQTIFNTRCAGSTCHVDTPFPAEGQNLSSGQSFKNLVAMKSTQMPSLLRVNPGNATASYLYQKIIAGGAIAPGTSRMPQGCSGSSCLSDAEINTIMNWINHDDAPPPQ
jgi:hypothetical protein